MKGRDIAGEGLEHAGSSNRMMVKTSTGQVQNSSNQSASR